MDYNLLEQYAETIVNTMQRLAFSVGKFEEEEQALCDEDWLTEDEMKTVANKELISHYEYAEKQLVSAILNDNLNGITYMGIVFYIVDEKLKKLFNVFPIVIHE
jgi:hypothetical protein